MKNILVFPCGSEIGLDIYESVKDSRFFKLFGGSSVDDHGKFVFENYIPGIPFVNSPDFFALLKKIVNEYHIDAIYPAMDLCIDTVKKLEDGLNCKVVASPSETTEICLSKLKTYNILKEIVSCPIMYDLDNAEFPCFGKPEIGYGGIGARRIENHDDAIDYMKTSGRMLLEYLPGDEYTVDCFTNRNGALLYCKARKRNRIKSGVSVNTSFCKEQEEFLKIGELINSTLKFRGSWFFQVKRDRFGELKLMEIAARFGGSSNLSKSIGVNLPLLSLFDIFDKDVEILENNYEVELDRSLNNIYRIELEYDAVYVDYDDCLVINGKVNSELMKFLYSSIDSGKNIILLSKHKGNLFEELKLHRICSDLFSDIIVIGEDEHKFNYIVNKSSIFIDDSFNERKEVKDHLGLPVFGVDMVCVL